MKPFNKALHDDILELHKINPKTDRYAYRTLFDKIMKKHNVSRSTMYEELRKETPGAYKDKPRGKFKARISKEEMETVFDLMLQHKPCEEICRIMTIELGFEYTPERLLAARKKLYDCTERLEDPRAVMSSVIQVPHRKPVKIPPIELAEVDMVKYGEELKKIAAQFMVQPEPRKLNNRPVSPVQVKLIKHFFFTLAGLDLSCADSFVRLDTGHGEFDISMRVIKDCLEQISVSAAFGGKGIDEAMKFQIRSIVLRKLLWVQNGNFIEPRDLARLASINRTLAEMDRESSPAGYTLDDILKVAAIIAPNAGKDEVIDAVISVSPATGDKRPVFPQIMPA